MFKKVIFWEPSLSPHKVDLFEELVKILPDTEVICVADSSISESRKSLGWSVPTPKGFELIIKPDNECIERLVCGNRNVIHIFSGIRHVKTIVIALKMVKKHNALFSIMSEPRVREGIRGLARYLQSWVTEGWLRKRVSFVLAIGRNGPSWFSSVGYPKTLIFPFAYFIAHQKINSKKCSNSAANKIKVAYVGRLVESKGVEYLINALQPKANVSLSVVGDGILRERLQNISSSLSLNVEFLGVLSNENISAFLAEQDILVLPSVTTDDGWGVVVSEALMVGTAVIATDSVGASILLDDNRLGCVVPPRMSKCIAEAIAKLNDENLLSDSFREYRSNYARNHLVGEAGARYLVNILSHVFEGMHAPIPFYENLK